MADILISSLDKRFGRGDKGTHAIKDLSLYVEDGEFLVLLGPSGCGKTTTLRSLAGLEQPDSGSITIGERVVFDRERNRNVPIHRRDIGFVFQNYALWPHLTAYQTMLFPLQCRGVGKAQADAMVRATAKLLDLKDSLLGKRPGQLSGGQQQRVALARALVAEPAVVLFDEPLSNLDARLREQLRLELRSLHQRLGFTGVYVTHDLAEALVLGDRVAVMRDGVIQQVDAPLRVFQHPEHESTALLLGFRQVAAMSWDGMVWRAVDGTVVHGAEAVAPSSERLSLLVLPDKTRVRHRTQQGNGGLGIEAVISNIASAGTHTDVVLQVGEQTIRVTQDSDAVGRLAAGDAVVIEIDLEQAHLFGENGEVVEAVGVRA